MSSGICVTQARADQPVLAGWTPTVSLPANVTKWKLGRTHVLKEWTRQAHSQEVSLVDSVVLHSPWIVLSYQYFSYA